jgi:antitoxin YefM
LKIKSNRHILAQLIEQVGGAMHVISYSEARNSLKSVLDKVVNDVDVTIINRRDAANAVVMSLDHYNSLMETLHLLQSPANAVHLAESIAQLKAGKAEPKTLIKE